MNDSSGLRAAIQATSAFHDLSDANIAFLIESGELRTFEPGAVLMAQGEESDTVMLILSGEVTVSTDSTRGIIPISTVRAPCLVGETGALAQLPRTATVRACAPVAALCIGRVALTEVAQAAPSLLIDVIGRMGDRMRRIYGAIGLYTHALGALERHEFDRALLEELRNPIPDLADFGQTFGRMAEQIILRRQRDDEMASAAVIQRAPLPKVAEFAAETGLDVSAAMTPARDVGGDFFDLIRLNDGRVAFGVGDVCGKGVPAELFATLLYAAFDPRSGEVEYVSCGHLPPLLRRAGGAVEMLSAGGLPVGLFDQLKPKLRQASMRPGDLLFLYTDGVTEAVDAEECEFGEERLLDLIARSEGASAAESIARVKAAVSEFSRGEPQFDDLTCLAITR